jgi:hypothetical protein
MKIREKLTEKEINLFAEQLIKSTLCCYDKAVKKLNAHDTNAYRLLQIAFYTYDDALRFESTN